MRCKMTPLGRGRLSRRSYLYSLFLLVLFYGAIQQLCMSADLFAFVPVPVTSPAYARQTNELNLPFQ